MGIENALNEEFAKVCKWSSDNRPSVYFGKDKTKFILLNKENASDLCPRSIFCFEQCC